MAKAKNKKMQAIAKKPKRSNDFRDAAFLVYYGLGSSRSLAHTAKLVSVPLGTIKRWSQEGNWPARIQERELDVMEYIQKQQAEEILPTLTEIANLRASAIRNANALMNPKGRKKPKMLDNKLAWEIGRTEMGLPTKHTRNEEAPARALTPQELEAINAGYVVIGDEDEEFETWEPKGLPEVPKAKPKKKKTKKT